MNQRTRIAADRISQEIETTREFFNGNHKGAAPEMPVFGMRELVVIKQKQATEQAELWQRNLALAQEQVIRWDAIEKVCQELLAEAGEAEERKSGRSGRAWE